MPISSNTRKAGPFTGTGLVTTYPFNFKVFQAADVYVVRADLTGTESVLVLNTDYTVSLNVDQDVSPGGNVVLSSALTSGYTLVITSNIENLQPTDLTNGGGFYPSVITDSLDRACIQIQQLQGSIDRTLKVAVTTPPGTTTTLPSPAANTVIGWDNTGESLKNFNAYEFATVVAYGTAVADIFTGDGSTTSFTLSFDPANINNLDVSVGGLSQLPGTDYTWTSGTTLTFTTAPPNGVKVLVRYMRGLAQGSVDWGSITGSQFLSDQVYISSDTTITNAVHVLEGGGYIVAAGVSLTINAPFNAGLYQVFSGSGSVLFGSGSVSEVYPEWWGAKGDGVTDCSAAITYCLQHVDAPIRLSPGVYKINSCINGSELGTKQIIINGAGNNYSTSDKSGTTIIGNTNGWMFDFCGSTFVSIENIKLLSDATVATPSKGGILNARTALHGYVMYHYMKNVHIFIKSNPAFTSAGSIAVYADNQENQTYELCWFEADTPFVSTMNNELSAASPYTTIVSSPTTNTDITHRQVVYKGITGAGIILYGKGSSTFDQIFVQPHDGTNTYQYGIVLRNSTGGYAYNHALHFTGQVEDYDYALAADGDTYNLNFDMTLAGSVNGGIVRLAGGTNHFNPKINATWYAHTGVSKPLLLSTNTTIVNVYGGEVFVTTDMTLTNAYVKYHGTRITFAGSEDTRSSLVFNPASGSTYDLTSTTTPLIVSGAWTPGTIAANSSAAGGFSVPGAVLGDIVECSLNVDLQACVLSGYVQTANTVVLVLENPTGASVSIGPATYKIKVRQI